MLENKPTILIPLSIQFSVRYLLRTGLLEKIRTIANPVILLGWSDAGLQMELEQLGCVVYPLPKAVLNAEFSKLRKKIHIMHFDRISSCSTRIDRRRNNLIQPRFHRIKTTLRSFIYRMEDAIPGRFENLCQKEEISIHQNTNLSIFDELIMEIRPDFLFSITPYYLDEEFVCRAASSTNAKLSTAILSFDNLTTRPRIPVIFDQYLLWNDYNKQELIRIYPETITKNVIIVGSPQFDFYYDQSYLWDKKVWAQRLGIPENRPVILYAAGPKEIAPFEPQWVIQLDSAIESGEIPGNPIILLRRHPVDPPDRWTIIRQIAKNVIFDDPWAGGKDIMGQINVSRDDIEKLVSTLAYSNVHINASSTMTIDGAIFDKPQIGPAYDDQRTRTLDCAMKELYLREHYLPITNSGGLEIAHSKTELIQLINKAIVNPGRLSVERKNMVREICTFNDGQSTKRVFDSLKKLILN